MYLQQCITTNSNQGKFCKVVTFIYSIITFLNLYATTLNEFHFETEGVTFSLDNLL